MKQVEITYRYDTDHRVTRARPSDADEACLRLDEGNRAFAALFDSLVSGSGTARRVITVDSRDLGILPGDHGPPKQRPYAAVLGCSDARVPIELIFNEGPNDLFVVRVAGNGLGSEVLGSLRYAADHLGDSLKLVVVLGHSGCGAVSAAVDTFLSPAAYISLAPNHALRGILDRLLIVVHTSATRIQAILGAEVTRCPGYRDALVEASVVLNAALTAYTVEQELGKVDRGGLQATYGVYLLSTRQIWAPRSGSTECAGLARCPVDVTDFAALAEAVARSDRFTKLLEQGPA
jgi:carbonic anhydrase